MINWISLPDLSEYKKTIQLMEQELSGVISGKAKETVFLLEHSDTYTAGTNYDSEELLDANSDIPIIYTNRGGKFTYHGEGQRVIYPILDLRKPSRKRDIKLYVRNLEKWMINSLVHLGLKAFTIKDRVGIWVMVNDVPSKIAAIGVRVRKWVTYHGIAINISTDLSKYSKIIPCGISDYPVTSLKQLGIKISMQDFDKILKKEFVKIF